MGNILQRFSGNRGSMTLQNPEPETPKNVSNDNCEKSPAPLPVDEGTTWWTLSLIKPKNVI